MTERITFRQRTIRTVRCKCRFLPSLCVCVCFLFMTSTFFHTLLPPSIQALGLVFTLHLLPINCFLLRSPSVFSSHSFLLQLLLSLPLKLLPPPPPSTPSPALSLFLSAWLTALLLSPRLLSSSWISVLQNSKEEALNQAFKGDQHVGENNIVQELTKAILGEVKRMTGNDVCCDCGAPSEW